MDEQSSDFVDDIFEEGMAYEVPMPTRKRNFLPWHRPRKQFVREKQWVGELQRLLDEHPLPAGKSLTYLGLPGNDLLDLRHIHGRICQVRQCNLHFLGFNSGARNSDDDQFEMNLSLAEVKSLDGVDERSAVILDEFALLSNMKSLAYARAKEVGPFDVINMDLCDGFGIHHAGTKNNTYYNSVASLLSLQARQDRPWLLFLTTRTDRDSVNEEVLKRLVGKYVSNLNDSVDFSAKSSELFGIHDEAALMEEIQSGVGHLRVFLTGLSKWLISMALAGRPQTTVRVKSVMGYQVATQSGGIDLVSVAFRFDPIHQPIADPLGLANPLHETISEPLLALSAIQKIANLKDVDALLSASVTLFEDATAGMADLVELARYDRAEFMAWVQAGHVGANLEQPKAVV